MNKEKQQVTTPAVELEPDTKGLVQGAPTNGGRRVMMKVENIELDESIQPRANDDKDAVKEYAACRREGASFPPLDLYGDESHSWIGDGNTRYKAAILNGEKEIEVIIRPGGRMDALKHALGANATHGCRRTTADKRRCVEIALRELAGMSSRSIAEMCGVGDQMVRNIKSDSQVRDSRTSAVPGQPEDTATATVVGQDGKTYPAKKTPPKKPGQEVTGATTAEHGEVQQETQAAVDPAEPHPTTEEARMAAIARDELQIGPIAVSELKLTWLYATRGVRSLFLQWLTKDAVPPSLSGAWQQINREILLKHERKAT